jgi:hypothetical protein
MKDGGLHYIAWRLECHTDTSDLWVEWLEKIRVMLQARGFDPLVAAKHNCDLRRRGVASDQKEFAIFFDPICDFSRKQIAQK